MSILPASGKPIDLDQDLITDSEQADIVVEWLDRLISDMQLQILQHLLQNDLDTEWLGKVRSALRATIRTRFQVAETRRSLEIEEERHHRGS